MTSHRRAWRCSMRGTRDASTAPTTTRGMPTKNCCAAVSKVPPRRHPTRTPQAITVGAICGTGVRKEKRCSSPYAPPCTMVSANSGEYPTMRATSAPKSASGAVAAKPATTAIGAMHRMAVRDSGEGTKRATVVSVHKAQPHAVNTTATGVETSVERVVHGAFMAIRTHATRVMPTMARDGVSRVLVAIYIACPR